MYLYRVKLCQNREILGNLCTACLSLLKSLIEIVFEHSTVFLIENVRIVSGYTIDRKGGPFWPFLTLKTNHFDIVRTAVGKEEENEKLPMIYTTIRRGRNKYKQ